jgi:hypothetical protein
MKKSQKHAGLAEENGFWLKHNSTVCGGGGW